MGTTSVYKVEVPTVAGDLYFNVHHYPSSLSPQACRESGYSYSFMETNLTVVNNSAVATTVDSSAVTFKVAAA